MFPWSLTLPCNYGPLTTTTLPRGLSLTVLPTAPSQYIQYISISFVLPWVNPFTACTTSSHPHIC